MRCTKLTNVVWVTKDEPIRVLSRLSIQVRDCLVADALGLKPSYERKSTRQENGTLHQIGIATHRIVALHLCDESVTRTAKLLSMSHGSLSDWLARRTLPGSAPISDEDDDEVVQDR